MTAYTEVSNRFASLSRGELFTVDLQGVDLFEKYLVACPPGIYRTKHTYDCNTCRRFFKGVGNVVAIVGNEVKTIWEGSFPELDTYVKSCPIVSVFRTTEGSYGAAYNYGTDMVKYEHFHCTIAEHHKGDAAATGFLNTSAQVLKRGLDELSTAALKEVLDLIQTNGLYRGVEHLVAVAAFLEMKEAYAGSPLFAWKNVGSRHARFRNSVIGTLVVDISNGVPTDAAVAAYENKVAPANYKRPTAIVTQRMLDDAKKTIQALGLELLLERQHARLDDIHVSNVLWVDNDVRHRMGTGTSVLERLSVPRKALVFDKHATEITTEDLVDEVLPTAKKVEVLARDNFVNITKGIPGLFKWNNGFAWAYEGNTADSIKEKVKKAGGNVNAKLRVSLSWSNYDDLDIHCMTPRGRHIYFGDKMGVLDVDMNVGRLSSREPVENLAFQHLEDGVYEVMVHQYTKRESANVGFTLEVESEGMVSQFAYPNGVQQGQQVECLKLRVVGGRLAEVITTLKQASKTPVEKWGVTANTMVPVTAVMWSPNYWSAVAGTGARHLFFVIKGCRNPEPTRGFLNEQLCGSLEKHRKAFEMIGNSVKIPPEGEQFAGVGFTLGRGDAAMVTVNGRPYVVTF